jgi:hypothetical protein
LQTLRKALPVVLSLMLATGTLIFVAAAFALSKERGIALRVKKILRPQN